jgi:hypothetical protein
MKKIFVSLFIVMLLAPAVSMAAEFYAAEIAEGTETISVLSNKVTLNHLGNTLTYAAITGHDAGSKVYASSSQDTKIFSQAMDPVLVVAPGTSDSAFVDSGGTWKAL